jgi:hypothetical protein
MDKELAQLHDYARELLVGLEDDLIAERKATGREPSALKKVKKALSNLDFDPEAYGDIIESAGGDRKKLMNSIRRMEMSTMKAWELLADDTIHHLIQQRTGGSTLARAKGDVVRGAIRRLQDKYGMRFSQATGERGVIRGDTAQSNFAHKADDKATGLERASGIGKNPDASTTSHRFGTAGYAKNLTAAEIADEQALFEALDARIAPQLADFEVGKATDAPRVQAIREIPGLERAYMADNTVEEIAQMKKIARSPAIEPKILDTYKQLVVPKMTSNGVRLSFPNRLIGAGRQLSRAIPGPLDDVALGTGFGGVAAVAALATGGDPAQAFGDVVSDVAVGDLQGGELFDESQDFGETLQQSRQQNARPLMDRLDEGALGDAGRAIKRGGRLSIGAHGAKFTLPEFGFSEFFGINK